MELSKRKKVKGERKIKNSLYLKINKSTNKFTQNGGEESLSALLAY